MKSIGVEAAMRLYKKDTLFRGETIHLKKITENMDKEYIIRILNIGNKDKFLTYFYEIRRQRRRQRQRQNFVKPRKLTRPEPPEPPQMLKVNRTPIRLIKFQIPKPKPIPKPIPKSKHELKKIVIKKKYYSKIEPEHFTKKFEYFILDKFNNHIEIGEDFDKNEYELIPWGEYIRTHYI